MLKAKLKVKKVLYKFGIYGIEEPVYLILPILLAVSTIYKPIVNVFNLVLKMSSR